jgi:hypothetical protein
MVFGTTEKSKRLLDFDIKGVLFILKEVVTIRGYHF